MTVNTFSSRVIPVVVEGLLYCPSRSPGGPQANGRQIDPLAAPLSKSSMGDAGLRCRARPRPMGGSSVVTLLTHDVT